LDQILGRKVLDFVHPEDQALAASRIQALNKDRSEVPLVEERFLRLDGVPVDVEAIGTPIHYNGCDGAIVMLRDITERKRAAEALLASEAHMRALADNIPQLVWMAAPNGKQFWFNRRWFEFTGASPVDLEEQPWSRLCHPDYSQWLEERMQQAFETGQEWEDTIPLLGQDGKYHWFLTHITPVLDDAGGIKLWVGVHTDVNEQRKVAMALRESEERYSLLFHNYHTPMLLIDPTSARVVDANPAACTFYGWPRESMINMDVTNINVSPAQTVLANMQQAIRSSGSQRFLFQHRLANGQIRDVEVHSGPIRIGQKEYLFSIINDITERLGAEQALRESEARFRSLADAMPQLVWTAQADGTVDYYNRRYQEYHGISQITENDWQWSPVLHPDDLEPTQAAWLNAIQTGEVYQIEHRVKMANGNYRWHLSRGIPMKDADGKVLRWFGTATDIHEQKLAEELLKKSNQELEQFAFVASHDLQEPLRKIRSFSELLSQRSVGQLDGESLHYLERMRSATARMNEMIQDLLDLSRVSTRGREFERVDLGLLAADVVSDLEPRIQKEKGSVELAPLPTLLADPLQMRQLLQNLIGNAIKFHKPETPPRVLVSGFVENAGTERPLAVITVEDNGIGFEADDAQIIFHPFQRLHGRSQYEGSGMGLAICAKIVERHQGSIQAEGRPGEGATFIITLPVKN
jgi:PAS domain S-box-containing protein